MSIEELATMLGEQMYEAQAKAWDEGWAARDDWEPDWRARGASKNPYRKVSA